MPARTERRPLHFDLAHLSSEVEYTLHVGVDEHPLKRHDDRSRAAAQEHSPGLALVPETRLTHWVEDVELPAQNVILLLVTCPSAVEGAKLDTLVLSRLYVPIAARRRAWSTFNARPRGSSHPKLAWYGVEGTVDDDAVAVELDDLSSAMEAAMAVVFMHPDLANLDPDTAALVLNHIYYSNGIGDLASSIQEQAEQHQHQPYRPNWVIEAGWRNLDGTTVESITIPDPVTREPVTIDNPKRYATSPQTKEWAQGVMVSALNNCKNDPELQSTPSRAGCYSVQTGAPVEVQDGEGPGSEPTAAQAKTAQATTAGSAGSEWTVSPSSKNGGMQVSGDVSFDNGQLAVDITNWFLRWLSVSVQFQGQQGELLTVDDWTDVPPMDSSGLAGVYEDGSTKYLGMLSSVNTIMGVPLEPQPSTLRFDWPENASSATLLIGSLGFLQGSADNPPYTGSWNPRVCVPGFAMTSVFNLGIPMIFMVAGAKVEATEMNEVAQLALSDVLVAVEQMINLTAAGLSGNASPQTLLTILVNTLMPIVLSSSLALAAWVAAKVSVAMLEKSIPVLGWIVEGASFVAGITTILECTTELFLAPALYGVDISRQMDVDVTVDPDPEHQGQWPSTATHYQVKAIYSDGKVLQVNGQMDATTQDGPITVRFSNVPAGGLLRFIAAFYSETDWLAGQGVWPNPESVDQQNGCVPALPTDGGDVMQVPSPSDTVNFAIKENLVPLDADTYYHPKEELIYSGGERQWSSATFYLRDNVQQLITDLDAQDLSALQQPFADQDFPLSNDTSITVVVAGQRWLMVDPDSVLAYHVAYLTDTAGTVNELEVDPVNAETVTALSGSNVGANLGALIGISFSQATSSVGYTWQGSEQGLADCGGGPIDTGLVYAFQNISQGAQPQSALRFVSCALTMPQPYLLYDLNGPASGDGYNFYLDPRGGADNLYCLRKVILDQQSGTFDLEPSGDCWGRFGEQLDSMVVHPSGYVAGINTANSRLEVLRIPPQGYATDSDAPAALVLAGPGDRVGLLQQPVAVTASSDGRLLILEGGSTPRIQAMDTSGNPVFCFASDNSPPNGASPPAGAPSGTSATMGLKDEGTAVTYLDLGVETKGYLYVLKTLNAGDQVDDYRLDIYDPQGAFVSQTQGLNAAKIVVDLWRNLMSVNFRNLYNQSGRSEPSISEWIPSTPEG